MKPRQWALAGAFIGILFAIGSIARGDVAPGIVGGILAGVLCYLVLRQISERQWQRIREWDRRHGGRQTSQGAADPAPEVAADRRLTRGTPGQRIDS